MTDQAPNDHAAGVFARLATVPVPVMVGYLSFEMPQTAAATLLLLPPERAAKIANDLPPDFRQEVLRRMARSEAVLATILDREFLCGTTRPATPDRHEEVRRLIALMDPELRDAAMAALEPPEIPTRRSEPFSAFAPARRRRRSAWVDLNAVRARNIEAYENSPQQETESPEQETENPVPLLEVVYDRFVRRLSTSMRVVSGVNAEISLDYIYLISQADYLERLPLPALLCPFTTEGGGYCGMVVTSPQLLFEMAEVLLGGTVGIDMRTAPRRPFTTIECSLFELALDAMLDDLSIAFSPIGSATFRLDRIETNPRFSAIAPPNTAMYQGALRIEFDKGGGKFHLLLSDAALDPLREIISQPIVPPAHQPKPPLAGPTDAGPKLKLATPPAERRNA
jgi:hypothetical protein